MSYATPDDLRRLIGLSTLSTDSDYKTDADLNYYLTKSATLMLEDFCITNIDESISGNIDGSNTTFEVSYTPISDVTFDGTVGTADVAVYTWTDSDDPSTKSSVATSTVYPYDGVIILSSAPATTVEDVTCTYRYYLSETIRFDLLPLANAYLAGWMYISSEFLLTPDQYAVGALRYNFKISPITKVLDMYYKTMGLIRTKHWSKKMHSDIELLRG